MSSTRPLYSFAALLTVSAVSCSRQVTEKRLQQRANDGLAKACASAGKPLDDSIWVATGLEGQVEQEGQWAIGVRFDILINGKAEPRLAFGSVGVGNTVEDAQNTAVEEWLALFGAPYCAARAGTKGGVTVGGLIAYPSPLGLRGQPPGGWVDSSEAMHEKVLAAVIADLELPPADDFGMLDLKVVVKDDGTVAGECRKDGAASDAVLDKLKRLDWPKGTYMFKQNYVLARAQRAAQTMETPETP